MKYLDFTYRFSPGPTAKTETGRTGKAGKSRGPLV